MTTFKVLLLALGMVGLASQAAAQSATSEGDQFIQAGVGLGMAGHYGGGGGLGIYAGYDRAIKDNITLGGMWAISSATDDYGWYGYNYEIKYTYNYFGARGLYHFDVESFDVYAGLGLGYTVVSVKDSHGHGGSYGSYPYLGVIVGAKYEFASDLNAVVEMGTMASIIRVGVSKHF